MRTIVKAATWLVGCVWMSISLHAQEAKPNTPAPAAASPAQVSTAEPGRFYDKDLDIHFNYPVEMEVRDAAADMAYSHIALDGKPGDSSLSIQQDDHCFRSLLNVNLPAEKAPKRMADIQNIWIDSEENKSSRVAEPIMAKIEVVEFARDCLPKDIKKKDDEALRVIARSYVSISGLKHPDPWWFEVAGQKMHMDSGVGRPIVNGKLANAPIIDMAMSMAWKGHLLTWIFMSNDVEIFNGMTKSIVQFGNGPWGTMFPTNFGPKGSGSGTPVTVLPK